MTTLNPTGQCECGCGDPAPLAKATDRARGYVKGESMRFIFNHQFRGRRATKEEREAMSDSRRGTRRGSANPMWKGGKARELRRVALRVGKQHPMADRNGIVLEHRLVMAGVLGRYLTAEEIVHHVNEDPFDNRPENLLVVNRAQHLAIHALLRCGFSNDEAVRVVLERASG